MQQLKELYLRALREQTPTVSDPVSSALPQMQQEKTFELPKLNLSVSLFEKEKRILFSPLDKEKPAPKVRSLIVQLRNEYDVKSVKQKGENIWEVQLDPRQSFYTVVDFVKQYEI